MNKKYRPMAWIALALVLILVSCIGAGLIQTDFGNVTITDVRIPMPDGETLRVLVHRPSTATQDNPAPCVITSHGYHATLETQDITSIELARRGYALRPAPVKHSGRAVGLLTFSTVFLGLILVLLLGGRQPTPAGTAETPELSPVRQQLIHMDFSPG